MKTQELFFIVRIEVQTAHESINDALEEREKQSRFLITNTPKVQVMNLEILITKTRNINKKIDHCA